MARAMKTNAKRTLRALLDLDDQGVSQSATIDVARAIAGSEEPNRTLINQTYAALAALAHRGYLREWTDAQGVRRWSLR